MIDSLRMTLVFGIAATPMAAQSIDDTFAECAQYTAINAGFEDEARVIDTLDPTISYIQRDTDLGLVTIKLFDGDPFCSVMGVRFTPDYRHTTVGFVKNEAALTSWVIAQAEKPSHAQIFEGLGAKTVVCNDGEFLRQVSISSGGTDDQERSFIFIANGTAQNPVVCQ